MIASRKLADLQSWPTVARWTLLGTLACICVSVAFNTAAFGNLGQEALQRSIMSATVLPIMLGVPLFLYMSLRVRKLAMSNLRLGLVAQTDSLTSCLNRGAFTSKVTEMLDRQGPQAKGTLLMIDADNFKSINDLFGHDVGDDALMIISRSIRATLRPQDLVGRMGGEEFGVYLPDLDQTGAENVAERIRRAVNLAVFTPDGTPRQLSVSIGGATFSGQASFSTLFRIADQRLYGAKQRGRNRVTVVNADDHPEVGLRRSA